MLHKKKSKGKNSTNSTNLTNSTLADGKKKADKKEKKGLHLFPHSHTDEGWLSTTAEFFSGEDDGSFIIGSVKDILTSVLDELQVHPRRTFAFAEIKYFKMWYDPLPQKTKNLVKRLV